MQMLLVLCFFFFNDTATTEIYTLSLHDALPISSTHIDALCHTWDEEAMWNGRDPKKEITFDGATFGSIEHWADGIITRDRKSTRLNSSHGYISYAVFCLKKKKKNHQHTQHHHAE